MSEVLVVAEHRGGELRDVSFEAITAGQELASGLGASLAVVAIGKDSKGFANELNCNDVDTVYWVPEGENFNHDIYHRSIVSLASERDLVGIVIPHSVNGLDYAPAVASTLDTPIVTDVTGIATNDGVVLTRERYGSKVETDIVVTDGVPVVTIRSTEWVKANSSDSATVREFPVDIETSTVTVEKFVDVMDGDIDISQADILISIGRGIAEEENLSLIQELAEVMDATLSASRPIVDNGWLPDSRQVGQSGKIVTPDVYLAIGISGAVQHVAGMKGSDTIIAINTDPNAPIFDIADYGIVDDLFEVVPSLISQFE
ncbi:electron transfer flavoprotein subunit alpha/FixB family protein [Haladaptatus sp. SPP-AMP-3]|uniref:electron transfer flavoprotein subunit alpha/FixB family protein n=1 Tax=Haladaptatus sp. SPP-AMP-3 TaxID=3121295 RepID=UPI003C2AE823